MLLNNQEHVKHFRRWLESQNFAHRYATNLSFVLDVHALKKKQPTDIVGACQKIASKYIGSDGPAAISCDPTKVEAFRTLANLFGVQSAGVFDDIYAALRAALIPLWRACRIKNPLPDATPDKPVNKPTLKAKSTVNPNRSSANLFGLIKGKRSKEGKDGSRKGRSSPRDDEDNESDVVAELFKSEPPASIAGGTCARCHLPVQGESGIGFGVNLFHLTCLKCRVCTMPVPPEYARVQDRTANLPICKNCDHM